MVATTLPVVAVQGLQQTELMRPLNMLVKTLTELLAVLVELGYSLFIDWETPGFITLAAAEVGRAVVTPIRAALALAARGLAQMVLPTAVLVAGVTLGPEALELL